MLILRSFPFLLFLVLSVAWIGPVFLPFDLGTRASAQAIELERVFPIVEQNGEVMDLAWLGGLNAAQFQAADLDDDGLEDLLLYDRAGQVFVAVRRLAGNKFEPAPELLEHFPTVSDWMAVRDYNLDGVPDLFTFAPDVTGIQVLRGRRQPDGLLAFDLVDFGDPDPALYFEFENQRLSIFVSAIDYPSIVDADADGDLDILTFNVLGGYLDFFKNVGVERGLGADTLVYELQDRCWGGFFENGLSTSLDLSSGPGECFQEGLRGGGVSRHSGSTVLNLDYNGDGLMDVMLGDISYSQLTLGINEGSQDQAWIGSQDAEWQTGGVVAQIPSFPAAFHLDVDDDGDNDILGAPTNALNAGDVEVAWWYENTGSDASPNFEFKTSQFLIDQAIDVGTMANVTTFDYDGDGRLDLVVGNNDEYTGTNFFDSRLRLFRNVTVDEDLRFELIDEDYLGLSEFFNGTWAFAPSFGDLDGDGDQDAVIGVRNGKFMFLENTAGPGATAVFARPVFEWFGMDANQRSKPFIVDLDRDGLNDIIAGGADGRIRFFKNTGTATEPAFVASDREAPNILQLGKINTNAPGVSSGHPTPHVIQSPNKTLLITGNRSGTLEAYEFAPGTPLDEEFTLLTKAISDLQFGSFSDPTLGDFDGDGLLEAVVGNERGGLEFFVSNLTSEGLVSARAPDLQAFDFNVSPNPSKGPVVISGWPTGSVSDLEIFDVSGKRIYQRSGIRALPQVRWNGEGAAPGVYFVRLSGPDGTATRRIVRQ
ncbi:T9SS type A sorting domain-containing protein [Lewinella sp. 4G2]|uniref:T9SS type A sorting domain-containing protein n=1 Tax=Lewinella sp. 4G2 TaxID=1803372 RepID=UPI0012F89CF7|nr:T9SS type A sorting domain-containing protein [Lewinella sp. 4G2]